MFSGALPQAPTEIMLLGSFHFQDRGVDRYKPKRQLEISARQAEIQEIVERLSSFEPTKVAVEFAALQQSPVDHDYRAFLRGAFELSGSEHHQLGFRLARKLGHERVHAVDAWGRFYEPPRDLDLEDASGKQEAPFDPHEALETYAREHDQEHLLTQWSAYYLERYTRIDEKKTQRPLRETLLELNQLPNILAMHGHYLVDHFKVGTHHEYPGVDVVTAWYNRNLRIFANLQRITEPPCERLLVVYGAGHIPILRHCAEASPEYDLVEVSEYLG